ncbi:hypothetical protein ETI01_08030 [Macrococcoides caseolyticum]|uniref:YopX family protein n=1 Tax=Macrococcoides caseolyticum TaxID=69966 RepID=UPI00105F061A|nr:YopX family protein [Macrococcus caseolyticus]TDM23343.1 hypothetical protein ETI01_08030 [Macrococcus caseolyticus]
MIPKFRIFDKQKKQMVESAWWEFYFEDERLLTVTSDSGVSYHDYELGEVWELIQSTGLHDKNGKEIFDGDIVKALSEGYCGTFQVKWRNEGTPMYILYPAWQNEQFWDLKGVNGVDDGIEVIGNIHEHPELLNQPNE